MQEQQKTEAEILEEIYNRALALYQDNETAPGVAEPYQGHCQVIVDNQESNKGVLAALITLLLKKLHTPEQDIRLHQAQLEGGFSGRGLDTRIITPFLREQSFPHMAESGWLTRSLEQENPYDLAYPGNIRPATVKAAFLHLIDGVQCQGLSTENVLLNLFGGLIEHRDRNINLVLSRPVNLSVAELADKVRRHHNFPHPGASRLPVLAIYSILTLLVQEFARYQGCTLLPLEHHTAADRRTDLIGDVHIRDANNTLFEGYEIKHNIPITSDLIQTSFEKLRTTPVKRFYLLTTHHHEDYSEFAPDIQQVAQAHGCQLIVNGIDHTLTYYLRLVEDTSRFVNEYVSNLETDPSVSFQLKQAWNEVVQG